MHERQLVPRSYASEADPLQGLWAHEATKNSLAALSITTFTHALGWTTEEIEVFLAEVRADLRNTKIHSYWPM